MKSLKGLSDRELIHRLRSLVKQEQTITLAIIPHLVEVIRRGIHLSKGYGSLYEYCKGELGYTDASAWRRTRAAYAIVRCPQAMDRLEEGRVNLCTLGRVYKFLTPAVLQEICGKSKADVELIAAAYDAKGVAPDRIRPVMVPKAAERSGAGLQSGDVVDRLRSEVTPSEKNEDASLHTQNPLRSEVSLTNVRLSFEQKWKVEGVVSKAVKAKLDRCKALLSRKYPHGVDYDVLFGELADKFLEHMDPDYKQRSRGQRQVKPMRTNKAASKTPESRYIPAGERQKVWIRDKGRCTYVGDGGKRCNSDYNLQFDHYPIPFSKGGPSNASNLRLLCAKHNRFTAEKTFGKRIRV